MDKLHGHTKTRLLHRLLPVVVLCSAEFVAVDHYSDHVRAFLPLLAEARVAELHLARVEVNRRECGEALRLCRVVECLGLLGEEDRDRLIKRARGGGDQRRAGASHRIKARRLVCCLTASPVSSFLRFFLPIFRHLRGAEQEEEQICSDQRERGCGEVPLNQARLLSFRARPEKLSASTLIFNRASPSLREKNSYILWCFKISCSSSRQRRGFSV